MVKPEILSAEPLGNDLIAVTTKGSVDLKSVKVSLNGKVSLPSQKRFASDSHSFHRQAVTVGSSTTYTPPDTPSKAITYLVLNSSLASGTLAITAGSLSFNYTLPSALSTK